MTQQEYALHLEGVEADDLSMAMLRDLCDLLIEGAQRCVRLEGEGRSVARGSLPIWVVAAADLRIHQYESGSLMLQVKAPLLADVAPTIFDLGGPEGKATGLDLLLRAASDAAAGRGDSEHLDAGVLDVLKRAGSLFARGGTKLSIANDNCTLILDAEGSKRISKLAEETPPMRVSRVSGTLDSLTMSTRAFVLAMDDGQRLRGFAGDLDIDGMRNLLGTKVLLEGTVFYRPSGRPARMDVDFATAAADRDSIWGKLSAGSSTASRTRPAPSRPEMDELFGSWPGDETDEQLADALRNLSEARG